jgi:hypothetical protein
LAPSTIVKILHVISNIIPPLTKFQVVPRWQ